MKRILVSVLLLGITILMMSCSLFSQAKEKIVVDNMVKFKVPENEMIDCRWENSDNHDDSNVSITVNTRKNEDIKRCETLAFSPLLYEQLKKDNLTINKEHLLKMIDENDVDKTGTFSIEPNWFDYYGQIINNNYLSCSYEKLIYDNIAIGESYVYLISEDLNLKEYFSIHYSINFILSDRIVYIDISLSSDDSESVIKEFPKYFEIRNEGKTYWKNKEARNNFYLEVLNTSKYKKLPETIRLVKETRDMILKTLEINEEGFKE